MIVNGAYKDFSNVDSKPLTGSIQYGIFAPDLGGRKKKIYCVI